MSKSTIETGKYWDFGWQLVESCTRVSPACTHCWSLAKEKRFGGPPEGQIVVHPERLDRPLRRKKPATYSIWNDLFHPSVSDDFIRATFSCMLQTRQHTYMVLTKRPKRAKEYFDENGVDRWASEQFPNLWLGVTCENQKYADERIPELLKIPAAVRFVSLEPLLSDVNLSSFTGNVNSDNSLIIVGPETGPNRRWCKTEWIGSIIEQCDAAGVPCFVKAYPMPDGRISKDMSQWPPEFRRRELP